MFVVATTADATTTTTRDPVDRFVSAFYWRILKICHPEKDKRIERPKTMGKKECLSNLGIESLQNEIEVLFYRYDRNASLLAEDLCSTNETTARIARESLGTILHAKDSISDWLDFYWNGTKIFPVVLEPGAEQLEDQIDNSMLWLHNASGGYQSLEKFQRRAAWAAGRQKRAVGVEMHTASRAKKSLTQAAETCLIQFYQKDYQLLKELYDNACKTSGCRQAIQSILDRRKPLLDAVRLSLNATNDSPKEE